MPWSGRCDRRPRLALVGAALLVILTGALAAADGKPVGPDKKLIGWGCNAIIDTAWLKAHVGELQRLPMDGLVITLYPDNWKGRRTGQEERWFGPTRFAREDFKQGLADLKATRFGRFTDNFIGFATTARVGEETAQGNLDWFDPRWSGIAGNGAAVAYVAREAGFKGLFVDFEQYADGAGPWRKPFDYWSRPDTDRRTLAECKEQARQRGREFMQAVTAVYPEIAIFMIPYSGWAAALDRSMTLLPAFVDGMLEGAGPRVTFVDGLEPAYPLLHYPALKELREAATAMNQRVSQVPALLKRRMTYGFGLWVDYDPMASSRWYNDPEEFHLNQKTPEQLQHTVYDAFTVSDRYVWLYIWNFPRWYLNPPGPEPIAQAYLDALRRARGPNRLDWSPELPRTPLYLMPGEEWQVTSAWLWPGAPLKQARFAPPVERTAAERAERWSPTEVAAALGYVTEWQVIGPFAYDPARILQQDVPTDALDPAVIYPRAEGPARWSAVKASPVSGVVDLRRLKPKEEESESVCAYAACWVELPPKESVVLRLGSNDGAAVWLDGRPVLVSRVERSFMHDQDRVALAGVGWHLLMVKVVQTGGAWEFAARFTDAGGRPLQLPKRITPPAN